MDIFVNGIKLDFELENEQTAFDVVTGLGDFYAKEEPQQFITSIVIDSKEYSYADELSLKKVLLSNVKVMEFEFNDIIGVSLLSLKQISLYLDFIAEIFEKNQWDDGLSKVIDSLSWMKQGISQIVTIFGTSKGDLSSLKNRFILRYQLLEGLITGVSEADFPLSNDKKSEILFSIRDVQQILQTFFKSINSALKPASVDDVVADVDSVILLIDELIPSLSEVPVKLQKGDDRGAMEIIQNLAVAIDRSVGVFVAFKDLLKNSIDNISVNGESFDSFFGKLTDNLKDLMGSMENRDSVMMGDLVEYEFTPYAEEIKRILLQLKENALVTVN